MLKSRNSSWVVNAFVLLLTSVLTFLAAMQMPQLLAEMILLGMFVFPLLALFIGFALALSASMVLRIVTFRAVLPGAILSAVAGVLLVGAAMSSDAVSDHFLHVAEQQKKWEAAGGGSGAAYVFAGAYAYPNSDLVLRHVLERSFWLGAVDRYGVYDAHDRQVIAPRSERELWEQLKQEHDVPETAQLADVDEELHDGELRFHAENPSGQYIVKPVLEQGRLKFADVRYLETEVYEVE